MLIWKYDENNKITHLNMIEVPNDHQLSSDELKTLPDDFLTPAKLVNGVLTSATQEESDKAAEDYRKVSRLLRLHCLQIVFHHK